MSTFKLMTKAQCLREVKSVLSGMKTLGEPVRVLVFAVAATSKTSDAATEIWAIKFQNLSGRAFKSYVEVTHRWKKGGWASDTVYPVTMWRTQKEFMDFMARECDK